MDFFEIRENYLPRKKVIEIYPAFKVCRTKDIMVRGRSFYAIWDEDSGRWSTDEYDVARLVDKELYSYANEKQNKSDALIDITYTVKSMSDYSSKIWVDFKNYLKNIEDNYKELDTSITFSNTVVQKKDFISKNVSYSLEEGNCDAYNRIMSVLYSDEERAKLEWAIGAIVKGEAKKIQKFLVLYGDPGTGKSTVLEIIQKLFEGYYSIFEAKSLASNANVFSTEQFRSNPLVAIQHDGDLSRIEDNTKLNSIISHETILINEKFKSGYPLKVNCFLFMATNKPVKITDGKAGLIRRLIDVRPTGNKVDPDEYYKLMEQINFELGAIAFHCLNVYEKMGKEYYNKYRPVDMMYKTDPFFNFVENYYEEFTNSEGISLKQAYSMYKQYCDETNADYKLQMYKFREELKNYFLDFKDVVKIDNIQIRSYYSGFNTKKFDRLLEKSENKKEDILETWIDLKEQHSLLDDICKDYTAQYGNFQEIPSMKWQNVSTVLEDLDTRKLHYILWSDIHHIVVDFDIKDENGNKSLKRNLEAATKWPKTYVETSKSGNGIHLHYFYSGDPKMLSRIYDEDIEIKVFTGNSSLRRKLILCNDIPISTISSGLPLKQKGDKVIDTSGVKNENHLRALIKKALNKEVHEAGTKPNIDFIFKILDDFYEAGNKYDVTDLRPAILSFAASSTNQSQYCIKLVGKMKFKSEDPSSSIDILELPIAFYDIEVFPNLFLINWKLIGKDKSIVRMINPTANMVEELIGKHRLVGFNCRRYDNHLLWARMMKYNNEQLYNLSQKIINSGKKGSKENNCFFGEAYNISYTDIYDYASKKQSLKKWEIELGIHHQELGLPWDKPVPEELWDKVASYCDNDVIATEAVWEATQGDFLARQILAALAGGSVNDTTNSLTTKIIFGKDRHPGLVYTDLATGNQY